MEHEALHQSTHSLIVPVDQAPVRLDAFIAQQKPEYSRTYFKTLATSGFITINGTKATKGSMMVRPADRIEISFPPPPALDIPKKFEGDLGVKVVFEHKDFLIIYKPAGLLCHAPTADSPQVTLVDWLLTYFHEIKTVGSQDRPGIVHRLDKDTSGLMIIPRNNHAHMLLSDMFKNRHMHKTYWAVVKGTPQASGTINYPIDRHPLQKNKMTHISEQNVHRWNIMGREATTHYKVLEQFKDCALIEAKPVTGRTHQIRVHCAALGHGLLGDDVYGIRSPFIERQALHAQALSFEFEGKEYSFTQGVPEDFKLLVEKLKA